MEKRRSRVWAVQYIEIKGSNSNINICSSRVWTSWGGMRHVRSKAAYRTSCSKDVHLISVPIQSIPAETYCGRVSKWWSANDQCSERHRWRPRPNIPVDRKNPNVSSRSTKKVHSAPYIARYLPSWHRWDGPHGVWLWRGDHRIHPGEKDLVL